MKDAKNIIHMRNVLDKPDHRALDKPLFCVDFDGTDGEVPAGFEWDGSSVPRVLQRIFPRHRHPIASCRHDWRCRNAKNPKERAWADKEFEKDVGRTSWWITKKAGYLGVRIGALFGVGCNY